MDSFLKRGESKSLTFSHFAGVPLVVFPTHLLKSCFHPWVFFQPCRAVDKSPFRMPSDRQEEAQIPKKMINLYPKKNAKNFLVTNQKIFFLACLVRLPQKFSQAESQRRDSSLSEHQRHPPSIKGMGNSQWSIQNPYDSG